MQKWSDAGIRKEILQGFPSWLGSQPLVLWVILVPLGILSDFIRCVGLKTPSLWGCGFREVLGVPREPHQWGGWGSRWTRKPLRVFGRACQRQQDSEGCRSIPQTSQQPWSAHGDLLQHRKDTPKQCCRRRLRKVGSPWHSQALPLSCPKSGTEEPCGRAKQLV